MTTIISPFALKFGIDNFAGKATIGILIALVVLIICFIGGLLMKIQYLKRLNQNLEDKLMKFVPSYAELKMKQLKEDKK